MKVYKARMSKFSGTDFRELYHKAYGIFNKIKKRSKRRTYVRSAYFEKEKIFLDLFWHHLFEKKHWRDRARRIKYFGCAIELVEKSRFAPISKKNPNKPSETLHRFYGITADNELFCVQIKEDRKIGNKKKSQKFLISVFPTEGPSSDIDF